MQSKAEKLLTCERRLCIYLVQSGKCERICSLRLQLCVRCERESLGLHFGAKVPFGECHPLDRKLRLAVFLFALIVCAVWVG